jgi:hypothetical protein
MLPKNPLVALKGLQVQRLNKKILLSIFFYTFCSVIPIIRPILRAALLGITFELMDEISPTKDIEVGREEISQEAHSFNKT